MKLGIAGTPLPDYESMTDEEIVACVERVCREKNLSLKSAAEEK